MYRVLKKINNNVVLARDEKNQELLLRGRGLGFGKVPYELTDDSFIESIYVNVSDHRMLKVLNEVPIEIVDVTEKIIESGQNMLEKELNKMLLLTLSDHLAFAVERVEKNIQFDSTLQYDFNYLYPEEIQVGKMAVRTVKEVLGVTLPQNEVFGIALHFINAEYDLDGLQGTYQFTQAIAGILKIVEKYMEEPLDKESIPYSRFITHLRYFVVRKKNGVELTTESDQYLESFLKGQDDNLQDCVQDIETYVSEMYGWSCSKNEKIYLMIHLKTLTYHQGEEGEK